MKDCPRRNERQCIDRGHRWSTENSCDEAEQGNIYSSGSLEGSCGCSTGTLEYACRIKMVEEDNGYVDITNRYHDRRRGHGILDGFTVRDYERKARGCTQRSKIFDDSKSIDCFGMKSGDHRELHIHDYRPIQFESHSSTSRYVTLRNHDEYNKPDFVRKERGCTRDDRNQLAKAKCHLLCVENVRGCTRAKGDENRSATQDNVSRWHCDAEPMMKTLSTMMFVLRIGTMYLWILQMLLYAGSRLLFLHAEVGYAHIGTELGWQITRGVVWAAATFGYLCSRKSINKRRLQIVQQRRFSLGVRHRRGTKMIYALFACMVLNTHAVAVIQQAPPSEGDIIRNDTDFAASPHECRSGRHRLSGINCDDRQRLQVYGHHSVFGACGPRYANVERRYLDEVSDEACKVWRDFEEDLHCRATVVRPQPGRDHGRVTYVANLGNGEPHGTVPYGWKNCKFTFSMDLHFRKNLHSKFT